MKGIGINIGHSADASDWIKELCFGRNIAYNIIKGHDGIRINGIVQNCILVYSVYDHFLDYFWFLK